MEGGLGGESEEDGGALETGAGQVEDGAQPLVMGHRRRGDSVTASVCEWVLGRWVGEGVCVGV